MLNKIKLYVSSAVYCWRNPEAVSLVRAYVSGLDRQGVYEFTQRLAGCVANVVCYQTLEEREAHVAYLLANMCAKKAKVARCSHELRRDSRITALTNSVVKMKKEMLHA